MEVQVTQKTDLIYGARHRESSDNLHFLRSIAIKSLNPEPSRDISWDGPHSLEDLTGIYYHALEWYRGEYQKLEYGKTKEHSKEQLQKNIVYRVNSSRSYLRDYWYHLLNIKNRFKTLQSQLEQQMNLYDEKVKQLVSIPDDLFDTNEMSDLGKRYVRTCLWLKPFDVVMGYTDDDGEIYRQTETFNVNGFQKAEIEKSDVVAEIFKKLTTKWELKNIDQLVNDKMTEINGKLLTQCDLQTKTCDAECVLKVLGALKSLSSDTSKSKSLDS